MRTLLLLLVSTFSFAQCTTPSWIHAPRYNDSLHISFAVVPGAQFYYVYFKGISSPGWTIEITGTNTIVVPAPSETTYVVNIRPNCQAAQCCPNHK